MMRNHGLVNVLVHPDYLLSDDAWTSTSSC